MLLFDALELCEWKTLESETNIFPVKTLKPNNSIKHSQTKAAEYGLMNRQWFGGILLCEIVG